MYQHGGFTPLFAWESAANVPVKTARAPKAEKQEFTDWQTELYAEMQNWVGDKLNLEPHHIDLDVTFSELGVDSIEAIDLVDQLQDKINRTIPATELLRYPTVRALIDHFATELNTKDIERQDAEDQAEDAKNTA